jgi:arylsulfatase A-like enzyme
VLITFDSLRADAVGGLGGRPGLMPSLEKVVQEADWAGRGIAASSWDVPAMASLFTGLQPWQHQMIEAGQARLPPELVTLPEALAARGYTAAGYWSNRWCSGKQGYEQGFDVFENLGRGHRAAERLEHLGDLGRLNGGRQLIWVHIPEPAAPYVRHDELIPRLGPGVPDVLPRRITAEQLQPFNDPARPLPPGRWRRISAMYRLNAARADDRLGRLLAALRASGQWDRTLLVITSGHGEDLGENGQVLHGSNLGRWTLEVPLVIKLPRGSGLRIAEPKGRRVAADRLWATLLEAAGGTPPPAVAPSLFRPAAAPVLSELYLAGSSNLFSLVDGDDQLLWETRFGPDAFAASPPLSGIAGIAAPGWTLKHWDAQGRSRPVNDPERARELARRLARSWRRFTPDELTPAEERLEWTAVPDSGGQG